MVARILKLEVLSVLTCVHHVCDLRGTFMHIQPEQLLTLSITSCQDFILEWFEALKTIACTSIHINIYYLVFPPPVIAAIMVHCNL